MVAIPQPAARRTLFGGALAPDDLPGVDGAGAVSEQAAFDADAVLAAGGRRECADALFVAAGMMDGDTGTRGPSADVPAGVVDVVCGGGLLIEPQQGEIGGDIVRQQRRAGLVLTQ